MGGDTLGVEMLNGLSSPPRIARPDEDRRPLPTQLARDF